MTTIVGLCGSLRHGSFNRMLLRAAVEAAPPGTSITPESIRAIPLYDADVEEEQGVPPAVQRLKDRIAEADGLLIVTPEYNNSIPGVLKNAIDWLSRPAADIPRVFRGRPVAIMGATTGRGGTALSQAAWLPVVRFLGMRPWFEGAVLISDAGTVFDSDGRVADAATRNRIEAFVEGFAVFAGAQQRQHDRRLRAALTPQLIGADVPRASQLRLPTSSGLRSRHRRVGLAGVVAQTQLTAGRHPRRVHPGTASSYASVSDNSSPAHHRASRWSLKVDPSPVRLRR